MWMQISQAWQQLAVREQRGLLGLAVFLLATLLYAGLWQPLTEQRDVALNSEQSAVQTWLWLNEQVEKNPAKASQKALYPAETASQLLSSLQRSLGQEKLLQAMKMTPMRNKVKVEFKSVAAPDLFRWLSRLERNGLSASQFQVKSLSTGVVQASVQFSVIS